MLYHRFEDQAIFSQNFDWTTPLEPKVIDMGFSLMASAYLVNVFPTKILTTSKWSDLDKFGM